MVRTSKSHRNLDAISVYEFVKTECEIICEMESKLTAELKSDNQNETAIADLKLGISIKHLIIAEIECFCLLESL